MATTMKRIITLILASIIVFNLSACGKTKQLLQPDPAIEKQQAGSDTTDYKKLYENECSVSSVRKYINWGLGLALIATGLWYIDKAAYSRFKDTAHRAEVSLYNPFKSHSQEQDQLVNECENILTDIDSFLVVATKKDKNTFEQEYNNAYKYISTSDKLSSNSKNHFKVFSSNLKATRLDFQKSAWGKYIPYRSLRTAGWNWVKSKLK